MSKIPGIDPLILNELQQMTQKKAVQRARENRVAPDPPKQEQKPPARQKLLKAIKILYGAADMLDSPLRFQLVEKNGKLLVQMLDRTSGCLVREVTPERVLGVAERMEKTLGQLMSELF